MSSGQTFLTLGAIVIFMYLSMNINRSYLNAARQTTDQQTNKEAVNYGQTLTEEVYATPYEELGESIYKNVDDVNNPDQRIEHITVTEDTLYATIEVENNQDLIEGVQGKKAIITVFIQKNGHLSRGSEYNVAITSVKK